MSADNNSRDAPSIKGNLLDGCIGHNLDAHLFARVRHCSGDRIASTFGMPDSIFVFDEREDAENAWAFVWTHPQIFRLKTNGKSHFRILEIFPKLGIDRFPRPHVWSSLKSLECDHVKDAADTTLQHWRQSFQFHSVVIHEAAKCGAVFRFDC